jgi:hypothetical protein
MLDPGARWFENRMADEGKTGPYRGFEHMHGPMGRWALFEVAQQQLPRGGRGIREDAECQGRR